MRVHWSILHCLFGTQVYPECVLYYLSHITSSAITFLARMHPWRPQLTSLHDALPRAFTTSAFAVWCISTLRRLVSEICAFDAVSRAVWQQRHVWQVRLLHQWRWQTDCIRYIWQSDEDCPAGWSLAWTIIHNPRSLKRSSQEATICTKGIFSENMLPSFISSLTEPCLQF